MIDKDKKNHLQIYTYKKNDSPLLYYEYHDKSQHRISQVHSGDMRHLFFKICNIVQPTQGLAENTALIP